MNQNKVQLYRSEKNLGKGQMASHSGIQMYCVCHRNRRLPATPFWKRPHSSAHTPCGLVPFPGRCGNIIWGAARHQHHHTTHRRVGDTQHGHGPREHTPWGHAAGRARARRFWLTARGISPFLRNILLPHIPSSACGSRDTAADAGRQPRPAGC